MSKKPKIGTGAKSALTRLQGGFSRYHINEVKGGAKVAPITLPHAEKLAEIGRKLEDADVQ